VVVFEGRDAAGKGGVISRIASAMSPRICRVVALSAPSDREKTQARARGAGPGPCAHADACLTRSRGPVLLASHAQWYFQRVRAPAAPLRSCAPALRRRTR
jgi:hypothetical protein